MLSSRSNQVESGQSSFHRAADKFLATIRSQENIKDCNLGRMEHNLILGRIDEKQIAEKCEESESKISPSVAHNE
jgi:hypothetical protein